MCADRSDESRSDGAIDDAALYGEGELAHRFNDGGTIAYDCKLAHAAIRRLWRSRSIRFTPSGAVRRRFRSVNNVVRIHS